MNNNIENEFDDLGYQIQDELQQMYESGQKEWQIEDIRSVGKRTYDILFDSYEEDTENGIQTTSYNLIESENEEMTFILTKN